MHIRPKNWREFQHYKDRSPPWIRLHRKLLDNKDFHRLPVASRALAPMLWLLASESVDGVIVADPDDLAFRLRSTEKEIAVALRPLIEKGFFEVVQDASTSASNTLAECGQVAVPEALQRQSITEAEADAPKRSARPKKCEMPEDFKISEAVREWAVKGGYSRLDEHLDAFRRKATAKAYTYANWDAAFMEAIREDWAKLRGSMRDGTAPPAEATEHPGLALAAETRRKMDEQAKHAVPPPASVLALADKFRKGVTTQ